MQETQVQSLGGEDPLEEGMATHSSILAWRTPWTEEPVGDSPWGSERLTWDFPGGTVDKNPPSSAGDMGSIPGPGRFHMAGSS